MQKLLKRYSSFNFAVFVLSSGLLVLSDTVRSHCDKKRIDLCICSDHFNDRKGRIL
jgi:hypothetical protein